MWILLLVGDGGADDEIEELEETSLDRIRERRRRDDLSARWRRALSREPWRRARLRREGDVETSDLSEDEDEVKKEDFDAMRGEDGVRRELSVVVATTVEDEDEYEVDAMFEGLMGAIKVVKKSLRRR